MQGLSLVAASKGHSSLREKEGFSFQWLFLWSIASRAHRLSICSSRALECVGSVVVACRLSNYGFWALKHALGSCGAWSLVVLQYVKLSQSKG